MLKKIFTIIILILILFSVGFFAWFYLFSGNNEQGVVKTLKEAFPFGKGAEDVDRKRSSFFGFLGDGDADETANETANGDNESVIVKTPNLRQLTSIPIAGAFASSSRQEQGKTSVLYVERQTGHVYEINIAGSQKKRLSNTTIPAVREVFWGNDGKSLILRYLDDNDVIKSFVGTLVATGTDRYIDGKFLLDDILAIAVSPGNGKFFTLAPLGTIVVGTITSFDNGKNEEIFNSSFTEWLVGWPGNNVVSLTTKASGKMDGFSYFLNTKTETVDKVIGGVSGLTTLASPDTQFVLYSESEKGGFKTFVYNTETNVSVSFPLTTLPEKCAWSNISSTVVYCGVPNVIPRDDYPDTWYQGRMFFSDDIWKIDIETGSLDVLASPETIARREIDLVNPILSKDEKYLIFTNKKDSTLWSLRLE